MLQENRLRQERETKRCIKNMVAVEDLGGGPSKRPSPQMELGRQPCSELDYPIWIKTRLRSVLAIQSLEVLGYLM